MKQTFRKLLVAVLVLCTFVGVLPMIAAEDFTAQAAAADIYYDFKKGNNGYPDAAADKRTAFAALTYAEVAARNTSMTSGAWAYHSYSATPDSSASSSDQTNFTNGSFFYYHYDKTKGFTMLTGARQGVLKAGIKFKGMNAGKYVPYLNINGAYLRNYSGTLTASIRLASSSSPIVTKEICLSDYPEDESYVQLSNAVSFSASEYVLELTIDNERTITIINGLQLKAADSTIVTGLYPTNDLGVYEVKVGQTVNVPFTQVFSDGTVTTNKLSGWGYTTGNSYVTAGVNSSSRYFTLKGVAETSTPQTVYFSIGNAKVKLNVIVRASGYSPAQSDVIYNFKKARPVNWSANHVHNFGKHIKYSHTAVGGYAEINKNISSAPWMVSSIASTSKFSVLYDGYGVEHLGTGATDLKIQVPVAGVYMPQIQIYTTEGVKSDVTISLLTTGGSTVCSKTIAAGTKTEYVNLATNGVSLSATEYIVRFSKSSSGSNYYNGIKLAKTNNTTVTLDPNGGTAGTKTSVTATNGSPMPGIDAEGYLPTRTGYRFGGYYDTKDTSGTQYYTKDGRSNHTWDKTSSTATLYAHWNVNSYTVKYNANGGSGTMDSSSHTYNTAKNLTANAFTRTGYTFAGWATSSTGAVKYADKASVKNLSSTNGATVNLYAVWTPKTSTVTLDAGGTVTATYDAAMPSITVPKAAGKVFGGYYDTSGGTGTQYYTAAGASARTWNKTGNVTLYAKWTNATVTLTDPGAKSVTAGSKLSFSISGSTNSGMGVTYSASNLPSGATFSGSTFTWTPTTSQIGSHSVTFKATDGSVSASKTVTITVKAPTATVTLNTGSSTSTVTATYGSAMPSITVPTKTGYNFGGYYTGENGSGTQYYTAAGASARNWDKTAATTLYAKWTAKTSTVTLDAGGTVTATYDAAMPTITPPKAAGKVFGGYYDTSGGTGTQYYTAAGASARTWNKTGNVTLYAKWTNATVTLTDPGAKSIKAGSTIKFTLSANTNSGMAVTYSSDNLPEGATLDASTGEFSWKTTTSQIGDNSVTFKATDGGASASKTVTITVTRPVTTVTLSEGGTITATYGEDMPTITPPKKAGKVFEGYYREADFSGTKYYNADGTSASKWNRTYTDGITIYAKWVDATVTFGEISTTSISAGKTIKFTLSATSNSGMAVTYSSDNLPEGATLDASTGEFSWKTGTADIGSKSVTFTATDDSASASKTVTITVTAPKTTVTLSEGGTVTATYGEAMPSITPPTKDGYVFAGYYDGENGTGNKYYNADGSSAKKWNRTVAEVPLYAYWTQGEVTFTQIEDKTVAIEEKLDFTVKATSTAPGNITYTAENLPEGATFDTATGKFSWTPTKEQVGEYTILFKGSDGLNYAEVTITVTVEEIKSTVTFDEGQDMDVIATYGVALPAIEAPEKEGFIFDGYYDGANGTKYYNADGTPAVKAWDKKDEVVTLYAKWVVGDDRLGTRVAVIRDIRGKRGDEEADGYSLYMIAGLDDRQLYDEVGFEVTIGGQPVTAQTYVVYQNVKDDTNIYTANAFGEKCNFVFVVNFFFPKDFKDATVTFRPYAITEEGETIYGKEATFEGIYTDLDYDDEIGGDLVIDGEVEYA